MNIPLSNIENLRLLDSEQKRTKSIDLKRATKYLAIGMMVLAYVVGIFFSQDEMTDLIVDQLPGKFVEKINSNPDIYKVSSTATNGLDSWLLVTKQQGWGGPMHTGTLISKEAKIKAVLVISHKETPSFYKALVDQGYFKQYQNKRVQDVFQIDNDIDAVSGATVSSRAIADAVRKGSHYWGRDHFKMEIARQPANWNVGPNEFILIVFFAIIMFSSFKKYRKVRYVTLAFGIVFLGFYLSMPISISSFASLLMGYVPEISGHPFWWLLVVGVVLMTVVSGRNLYCGWACPFGGIQEFITVIGGIKTKVNPRLNRMVSTIVFSLFWLSFMIMFLTSNPGLGTFEPFAVLFSFKGMGVQWYLVSIAIVGSFMIPRFWCRFFCPVGLVLKKLARTRQNATTLINRMRSNQA